MVCSDPDSIGKWGAVLSVLKLSHYVTDLSNPRCSFEIGFSAWCEGHEQASACRVHAARVVLCAPSHVIACMNLTLYAETATRAQKQTLGLQSFVSTARSTLPAVPGCSSSPRRDREVGLLGVVMLVCITGASQ